MLWGLSTCMHRYPGQEVIYVGELPRASHRLETLYLTTMYLLHSSLVQMPVELISNQALVK